MFQSNKWTDGLKLSLTSQLGHKISQTSPFRTASVLPPLIFSDSNTQGDPFSASGLQPLLQRILQITHGRGGMLITQTALSCHVLHMREPLANSNPCNPTHYP